MVTLALSHGLSPAQGGFFQAGRDGRVLGGEVVGFVSVGFEVVEFDLGGVGVEEEFPVGVADGDVGAAVAAFGIVESGVAAIFPEHRLFADEGVAQKGLADVLAIEVRTFGKRGIGELA